MGLGIGPGSSASSGGGAVTEADGANVALGTTSDASSANTVIGRLKKLISLLPTALGSAVSASSLPVVIASDQAAVAVTPAATESHLGEIGGKMIVATVTFTRPADTTAYAANDMVSNSTSATTLQALTASRANDKGGYIVGVRVSTNLKSVTPRLRVIFFRDNTSVTIAADNAQSKSVYADDAKRIGSYDLAALATSADTTNSDQSVATDFTLRIPFLPKSGTSTIYVALETLDAFTPASGESFTVTVWSDAN